METETRNSLRKRDPRTIGNRCRHGKLIDIHRIVCTSPVKLTPLIAPSNKD